MPHSLKINWGMMAYRMSVGQGIPLIFLHGTGCDSHDWDDTIARLTPGLITVAVDFRGHGSSTIPKLPFSLEDLSNDILLLADALRFQRCILVGHSLGGMVAMAAARRSDRVAGLVLLEGWTRLGLNAFEGDHFYGKLFPDAIMRIQRKRDETQQRFSGELWPTFWKSVEEFDGYAGLQQASIPILEVYGDLGRHEQTEALLRIPPNPRISTTWIHGVGHYLPQECPEEVVRECYRILTLAGA